MDDRGVSETLGTVLLFSVVVVSVAIAYSAGLPIIEEQRDNARLDTTVDGFKLLDSNIKDHATLGVEKRVTRLGSSSGVYRTKGTTSISVSVDGTVVSSIDSNRIEYTVEQSSVVYSSGAIIRVGPSGNAAIVEPPQIFIDDEVMYGRLVEITGEDNIAPSRSVAIRTELESQSSKQFELVSDVTVTVSSPYTGAWSTYLESEGFSCSSVDSDTIECSNSDVDIVSIQKVVINTRFDA